MKKYNLLCLSILIFALFSCKKEGTTIPLSGTVTLSSLKVVSGPSYATYGFSFVKAAIQEYPGQSVDILLIAMQPNDIITAIYFTAPDYNSTFNNTFYSPDPITADSLFNNYTDVTATDFKAISDTVKVGQVITYKSAESKYAKFLVKSIDTIQGSSQYVKVQIKWAFQPNGSTKF